MPDFAGVRGSLYCLLELDVQLCSRKDLTHLGDVMLQEVFVQKVSDLQSVDEHECKYFLTTAGVW